MNIEEIKEKICSKEYDFLRTNKHLGKNIMMLHLGGSHAYGLDTPNSDLDIRGFAKNSKEGLLGTYDGFEQVQDNNTDTTIYSFNKIIKLLTNANPNVIECLGLNQEHYIVITPIAKQLIDNSHMFLSKKAIYTFGGYANAQLRRLSNKSIRTVEQAEQEAHILNSIDNASYYFKDKFFYYPEDSIKLYIDDAINDELDKEIFMDINLKHYPMRDYKSMWSTMNNIVKDYAKIGHRNAEAIAANKLGKHMCHLVRLYYMCFDILEKEKIVTYRSDEHSLLMDIRNCKYLDGNNQPVPEFYELLDELEKRFEYDKENTSLPDNPDYKSIQEFTIYVNEKTIRGEI